MVCRRPLRHLFSAFAYGKSVFTCPMIGSMQAMKVTFWTSAAWVERRVAITGPISGYLA